jgi:hypothetical protein
LPKVAVTVELLTIGVDVPQIVKLRRKRITEQQVEDLVARTGMNRRQLRDHLRQSTPQDIGQWFSQHPEVTNIIDGVHWRGTKFIVSEHEDELMDCQMPEMDGFVATGRSANARRPQASMCRLLP